MYIENLTQQEFDKVYNSHKQQKNKVLNLIPTATELLGVYVKKSELVDDYNDKFFDTFVENFIDFSMNKLGRDFYNKTDEEIKSICKTIYQIIDMFADFSESKIKMYQKSFLSNNPYFEKYYYKNIYTEMDFFIDYSQYNDFYTISNDWEIIKKDKNPNIDFDKVYKDLFVYNYNFDDYFNYFDFDKLINPSQADFNWYLNLYKDHSIRFTHVSDSIIEETKKAVNENLLKVINKPNLRYENKVKNLTQTICLDKDKVQLIENLFDTYADIIITIFNENKYVENEVIYEHIKNIDFSLLNNLAKLNNNIIPNRYKSANYFINIIEKIDKTIIDKILTVILNGINYSDLDKKDYLKICKYITKNYPQHFADLKPAIIDAAEYNQICLNSLSTSFLKDSNNPNEVSFFHTFNDIDFYCILQLPNGKECVLNLLEKSLLKVIETCQNDSQYFKLIKEKEILNYINNFKPNNLNCSFERLGMNKVQNLFDNAKQYLKDYETKLNQLKELKPTTLQSEI